MADNDTFTLAANADAARAAAEALFATVAAELVSDLPGSAEVLHVGATAVPGCLTKGDFDIAIRYGTGKYPGLDVELLFRNEVFPACSPQLLGSGPPLREPADLRQVLADECQVMPLVDSAQRTDAARSIGVADPASERVARIGGICDDAAAAQDRGRHADQARLRILGVDFEILGHCANPDWRSAWSAAMRSSIGGCDANSAPQPLP